MSGPRLVPRGTRGLAVAAIVTIALAMVAWDGFLRVRRSLNLSESYGEAVNAPTRDPSSVTGYELGRRSLVLPLHSPDAAHWVMQTQAMSARGAWRVRHVDYDNAPTGREVHWSSPPRWWLLGLAWLDRALTGAPMPLAIERSALWAGPALFVLILAASIPLVARRFGTFAAALVATGMLGTFPFAVQYMAGNADHHGFLQGCAFAVVLCLVLGGAGLISVAGGPASAVPVRATARRWFAASAVAGAAGMWINAAGMVPVLVGVGIGAAAAMWRRHRDDVSRGVSAEPGLWRWWGRVGALGSLLAYLVEYAPGDFGWRLEVNHPLYALAWVGGGEMLCRFARSRSGREASHRETGFAAWGASVVAVLLVPGVVLVGGASVFLPADGFLRTLHADYIAEFQSLVHQLRGRFLDWATLGQLMSVPLLGISLAWLGRREPTSEDKARLLLAGGAAVTLFLLASVQVRWWGLACAPLFVTVAVAGGIQGRAGLAIRMRRVWRVVAAALVVLGMIGAVLGAWNAGLPGESDVRRLVERDVAHRLRQRVGTEPLVLAAPPDTTTAMTYFGGARGIGTMYWENLAGLRSAAAIFGAESPESARDLIERAGVTHIVLTSWDSGDAMLVRLHRGLSPDARVPADSFGAALRQGRLPAWLRPIAFRVPDHPALNGQTVRIYEVVEERPLARIAVESAAYLLEMGRAEEVAQIEPVLARFTDDLGAYVMLAAIQAGRRDARAFAQTMSRVVALRLQTDSLDLDDRVRLVAVLAIAGREAEAVTAMRGVLSRCDERALRRLTADSLTDLVELSDALGVPFPDQQSAALARRLLLPANPVR